MQFSDFSRIVDKLSLILTQNRARQRHVPVIEFHPFVFPFYDTTLVRRWNGRHLTLALKKKIERLGFHHPILFPSTPVASGVLGNLGESSSHYLCVDDYAHFVGAFNSVPAMESELLERVDSCFSVSDKLMRSRVPRGGESHFLPQGVDTNHFCRNDNDLPAQVAKIPRPIVGFFGLVASWIDLDLIVRSAKAYPKVSFVILGQPLVDIKVLLGVSNIFFLGAIPYEELPRFASSFNVGIIPFVINELTLAANPLKLLEYFSLGIPVVSTNLPEVKKFGDAVLVADDAAQFEELLAVALSDHDPGRKHSRRQLAEQYSWENIAEQISRVVERIEQAKHSS